MRDLLARWAIDLGPLRTNPVFRTLFTGRLVAVFGLSMLSVTVSIQVFALTGSSLQIALVTSVLGLSSVAGSFVGGSIADRVDRRTVILVARGIAVLGLVALALNAALPAPSLAAIYVITAIDAAIASAGAAAFGAAVPAVVDESELPATGAVMALSIDIGSALAPALAGVLIARADAATVYASVVVLGAVSWLVLLRLPSLPPEPDPDPEHDAEREDRPLHAEASLVPAAEAGLGARIAAAPRALWRQSVEAWAFARRDRVVGTVLLIGFLQILLASPFVLIPEFVTTRLGGGEAEIGLLYSAPAVGALIAGLTSGWVGRRRRLGVAIVVVFAASAFGIAGLGFTTHLWVACVLLGLVGAGDVIGEILRFTVLASRTPDRLRGRITGLWQAQATVGDALGGPLLALAARVVGVGPAIAVGGLLAGILTTGLLLRRPVRHFVHDPSDKDSA